LKSQSNGSTSFNPKNGLLEENTVRPERRFSARN
jgi:hypothetical protein